MNQKKVKSLSNKLTFRVIVIALVILLIAVILLQMSSNSFWNATEESIAKSTSITVNSVKTILMEAETLLEVTANSLKFVDYEDMGFMPEFLLNAQAPYPNIAYIYIGITEGNRYADKDAYVPSADWVLTQRPYYIGAMSTNGVFYTDPYLASTGDISSSLASQ